MNEVNSPVTPTNNGPTELYSDDSSRKGLFKTVGGIDMSNYTSTPGFNDKEFASKTYAGITRDQWADYQQRYMPIHGELFDATFSSKLVNEQLGRVDGNVGQSFKQAEQGINANRSRMGLESIDMNSGLDQVKASGHAKNNIRLAGEQRKDTAFTGAANSVVPNRGS